MLVASMEKTRVGIAFLKILFSSALVSLTSFETWQFSFLSQFLSGVSSSKWLGSFSQSFLMFLSTWVLSKEPSERYLIRNLESKNKRQQIVKNLFVVCLFQGQESSPLLFLCLMIVTIFAEFPEVMSSLCLLGSILGAQTMERVDLSK